MPTLPSVGTHRGGHILLKAVSKVTFGEGPRTRVQGGWVSEWDVDDGVPTGMSKTKPTRPS